MSFLLELLHFKCLVFRKHFRKDIFNPELSSDSLCCTSVISGNHIDLDAEFFQSFESIARSGFYRICDCDETDDSGCIREKHDRFPFTLHVLDVGSNIYFDIIFEK